MYADRYAPRRVNRGSLTLSVAIVGSLVAAVMLSKTTVGGHLVDHTLPIWNVDPIKPRHTHPHLALSLKNVQVLCGNSPATVGCNQGKGGRYIEDWRPPDHPLRPKRWLRLKGCFERFCWG